MAISKSGSGTNVLPGSGYNVPNGNNSNLAKKGAVFPFAMQQGIPIPLLNNPINKRESLAVNVNVMPSDSALNLAQMNRGGASSGASVSVSVAQSSIAGGAGDTPEIRKYKKKFGSEVLCAALWGVNLLIGTDSGLMLLDRSGQGKGEKFGLVGKSQQHFDEKCKTECCC